MSKIAIFVSGSGTNMDNLIKEIQAGKIPEAEAALVICDNPAAGAIEKAKKRNVPLVLVERSKFASKPEFEAAMIRHLESHEIDFIALAGYMKILTPYFIKSFPNKILNVHPSLLPSFKGIQGIKDAFTYGCKVTGATIHFVDDKMDHGPIIMQDSIKIGEDDTLETLTEKVHKIEHRIYPKAIALFAEDRLKIVGRKVKIL